MGASMKTHVGENYMTDDELVIGGKLTVKTGATITGLVAEAYTLPAATAAALGGIKVGNGLDITEAGVLSTEMAPAENQAASTATTVAGLKDDLNTLLAALKSAGLMEADQQSTQAA